MRGWLLSVMALGCTALLPAGCSQPTTNATGSAAATPTPSAHVPRKTLKELGMPLVDGFEIDSIGKFWLAGDYGTGLYVPGAIAISQDYARTGVSSARITVKEGDIEQRGDDALSVERAELDSGHYPLLGQDVWYGFSFLLPAGFPIIDNRLVIASWKQSDVEGSPLIGQRFRDGWHSLSIRPPGASGSGKSYELPDIRLGQWTDMIYHVRYSADADGTIEVWMNSVQVVS